MDILGVEGLFSLPQVNSRYPFVLFSLSFYLEKSAQIFLHLVLVSSGQYQYCLARVIHSLNKIILALICDKHCAKCGRH